MTGKTSTITVVSALIVALLVICFPAASLGVETTLAAQQPAASEPASPPDDQPDAQYQYGVPEQQASSQYGATSAAPEEGAPLGAGGPPTAEANPEAQYDSAAPIPSDCGTYDNPCSSDGVADVARPAAEDAHSTDEALDEAYENEAELVDASFIDGGFIEEAQAAEPAVAPPSGGVIEHVFQYGAADVVPADAYYPDSHAADLEQTASTSAAAEGETSPMREATQTPASEEAPPVRTETRADEVEPPTETIRDSEEVLVEDGPRPANQLSTIPFSATSGSLILALGMGALLYRKFGR